MKRRKRTPRTSKVRRDVTGGKRGDGNQRRRSVRRPDPAIIRIGKPDPTVTGVAGLVGFGVYLRRLGIDRELHAHYDRLKTGNGLVYPMGAQLRLLTDAFAVGETRVFGVEGLAADPLFTYLAGGVVPSIDILYDDLDRFDDAALVALEDKMAEHGLVRAPKLRGTYAHFDLDTSVLPIFGEHEGAVPGPNPRYRGRPSYHPMLARLAETGTIVGAQLRRGDTGFGADDVPTMRRWVRRTKSKLRRDVSLCVRIDSAGDCAEVLHALHEEQVFYVIKAKMTSDLYGAVSWATQWKTVDVDADNRPIRQVAELDFCRGTWREKGVKPRVIAVRSVERHGKQLPLMDGADWTVQVFLTNRLDEDANDVAWDYDKRAGIEPLIAECKGAWGIGHASSYSFAANHAVFLLKLLTHNLLDRYATEQFPELPRWRTPWRRRTLLRVPGRLTRSGRGRRLRLPPGSPLLPKRE
jgi:hypothetical protein